MRRLRQIPVGTRLRILALGLGLALALRATSAGLTDATKRHMVLPSGGGAGVGLLQLLQLAMAVGIVVAIIRFTLPKLAVKMGSRLQTSLGSTIKVEETASFAGGSLCVVTARGRTLLLSVGQQGVSCLADLSSTSAQPEPPAFFEVLDKASAQPDSRAPARAVVEAPEAPPAPGRETSSQELLQALARLDRIAG